MTSETDTKTYAGLSDQELIQFIFREGDRLPRTFAQEAVSRGQRLVPLLSDVIQDPNNWERDDNSWWSVVHASLLLGAIGGEAAVPALADAMFYASETGNDWVNEQMASIWGRIGPCSLEQLKDFALDPGNDCYLRERAMGGMAAVALRHPDREEEVFRFIAGVAANEDDEPDARSWAGNILLDFQRKEHAELLLALARSGISGEHFHEDDVRRAFAGKKDLYWYQRDWLDFYDAGKIAERQRRWEKERLSEDEARKHAAADAIAEDCGRSLPSRKRAAEKLGDLLILAQRADQALDADPEVLTLEELKGHCAAAEELHAAISRDPSRYRLFDGYLQGDLLDWILPLPGFLAAKGLVDDAARLARAWSELTHAGGFLSGRALILAEAGRETEARTQIRENLDRFPGDFWIMLKAGDAERALKDFAAAEHFYRRCLNLEGRRYERQEVLERLIPLLNEAGKTVEAEDLEAEETARQEEERRRLDEQRARRQPQVRQEPMAGRNEPCPCGSGKKFKKCCLGKAQ